MVSSIVPGATSAGALGVDQRFSRASAQAGALREEKASGDRVEISGPAAMAAARESVASGLLRVQEALALARDAQTLLFRVQTLAADPDANQGDLSAALQDYAAQVHAAGGNLLIKGQNISVQAEPGGPPLTIAGANLALAVEPGEDNIVGLSNGATLADRGSLALSVQRSLDRLQGVMEKFGEAEHSLAAHQGFLNAAQSAVSSVTDLNADAARLLALQVRQGLEAAGGRAIANLEPQAVLALFRV